MSNEDGMTIEEFEELIEKLCSMAEWIPWFDEYHILVVENCPKPFIIMDSKTFMKEQRRILGNDNTYKSI